MSLVRVCRADVRLIIPDDAVDAILDALTPETETPSSERSSAELRRTPGGLSITAVSSDTSALRACLNSYLRWVQGVIDVVEGLR